MRVVKVRAEAMAEAAKMGQVCASGSVHATFERVS